MENPWSALPAHRPYIAPCDRRAIETVLAVSPEAQRELHFDVLPHPHAGDPNRARVLLLSLNPGWAETDRIEEDGVMDWAPELRSNLAFSATTPFFVDPRFRATTGGGRWWTKRLRALAAASSWDLVGERLMCVEFFAYHSRTWRALPVPLASQEFAFRAVREAMLREVLIVVTRGWSAWVWNVPELYTYDRIIRLNSQRWVGITAGNLPSGDFDRVVQALTT
jgi:hypothetical protein